MATRNFAHTLLPNDTGMHIRVEGSPYKLVVSDTPEVNDQHVLFKIGKNRYVTGRSISELLAHIAFMPLDSELHYIEIGTGLSQLLPALSSTRRQTIIDPADYDVMEELLTEAKENVSVYPHLAKYRDTLEAFLERCRIIRDPKRIQLINMTLERALAEPSVRPLIVEQGDVVLDLHGALYYIESLSTDATKLRAQIAKVIAMEQTLVRPANENGKSGRLITR